ncbi:unnamed protein product, partial [Rotaria magnacalcarata]
LHPNAFYNCIIPRILSIHFVQSILQIGSWNEFYSKDSSNESQRMAKLHISIREITMCHFDVFMIGDMRSTSV